MKNVTVSLDDDTYRKARRWATEHDRSLSSVVREVLQSYGEQESEFERLARLEQDLYAELDAKGIGLSGPHISREDLYDPDRVRSQRRAAWE